MVPRRSSPPPWFVVCVAVALALGVRAIDGTLSGSTPGGGHPPDVLYGFWGLFAIIISAIWKGLEVAGRVTLAALAWSVKALWWFATTTYNGLKGVGQAFIIGLKKSWEFFRATYDAVLKPGLVKFWGWFDKFRHWLDRTFGPVLEWLRIVRDHVIAFYRTWVRPWLDLIDVARRTLRIFSALGMDWARRLDAKLGQLQELIDRPFRVVLGKLNEVINIVNRIVTLDGLIQRVTLLRSLVRDYQYVWNTLRNAYDNPLTDDERRRARESKDTAPLTMARAEQEQYLRDGTGPRAARLDELWKSVEIYVRQR